MERSPLLGLVPGAFLRQETTMGRRHVTPGSTAGNKPANCGQTTAGPNETHQLPAHHFQPTQTRSPMKKILSIVAFTLFAGTTTFAQQPSRMAPPEALMRTLPGDGVTVTD